MLAQKVSSECSNISFGCLHDLRTAVGLCQSAQLALHSAGAVVAIRFACVCDMTGCHATFILYLGVAAVVLSGGCTTVSQEARSHVASGNWHLASLVVPCQVFGGMFLSPVQL